MPDLARLTRQRVICACLYIGACRGSYGSSSLGANLVSSIMDAENVERINGILDEDVAIREVYLQLSPN